MRITTLPTTSAAIFVLLFSFTVQAESQFSIAPALLYFDYTEFSKSGVILDKETGWVPGLQLHLDKPLNEQLTVKLELTAYDGSVDYEGNTQTTTEANIIRFGAGIETPLSTHTDLIFGVTHNEWQRDIQDSSTLLGPFEIYRWWEISLGISSQFWINDTQSWQAEASLLRIIKPTIHVDLSKADLGKADLDLGTDWGARLQLSWKREITSDWQYSFSIFYEAWNFGRSGIKATSGGAGSLFVVEPRSETRHSGLLLAFTKNY